MILGVYCIKDAKVGWLTPTVDQNDASAARNFVHAMRNSQSILYTHPKDFDLYHIGEFDSETGKLLGYAVPELVFEGSSADVEVK